jgi:uncharacterized membrane protein
LKFKNQKLILLFASALFLRLIGLNQSFWLDEAISANIVKDYSFIDIIKQFSPLDFHPPLFYLLLKTWSFIFGASVTGLRLFSVTASLLAGFFLYKTGKLLFNKKTAFFATAFLLFNPLFVYYSQELRMYALVTFFVSASTYYFFKLIRHSKSNKAISSFIFFNLFIFLSFLTFYGSIFYIISLFLLAIIQKKHKLILKLLPGFAISLLLVSSLLFKQLSLSKVSLKDVTNWSLVLGKANLKNLLLVPIKFVFGRLTFYPKKIYYLIASLWTLFVFATLFSAKKSKKLMFLFLFPLILAFLISFKLPMLQFFRYLYLLPILSLLLSTSSKKLRTPLLCGFLLLSLICLLNPSQHREDWKSLSLSLPKNSDIYLISSFADPLKFYRPDLNIIDIRQFSQTDQVHKPLIFVAPYGSEIFAFDHKPLLNSSDFTHTQTQNFRQITLETWLHSSD